MKLALRELKMTSRYNKGQLTGREHLELVSAIKHLCRAWLRDEAKTFLKEQLGWEEGRSLDECLLERAKDQQTRKLVQGQITRFFRRVKHFVREGIVAAVMGLLGPKSLGERELADAERLAIIQDQYADRFRDEMFTAPPAMRPDKSTEIIAIAPPITHAQFVARVEQYGACVWGASQEIARASYRYEAVFDQERRWLSPVENCEDCEVYASMGWVPIGNLPACGENSSCRQNCACWFSFRLGHDGDEHVAGRGPVYDQAFGATG